MMPADHVATAAICAVSDYEYNVTDTVRRGYYSAPFVHSSPPSPGRVPGDRCIGCLRVGYRDGGVLSHVSLQRRRNQ